MVEQILYLGTTFQLSCTDQCLLKVVRRSPMVSGSGFILDVYTLRGFCERVYFRDGQSLQERH